ncbi:MAG: hypothetical protein J0G32_07625 [Alphaproteobacteria bacterium]|nr:hypothetical protein [Alphaproteobacteria bacterium]OJV15729.1 MAG: hypothetical protein BGO27_07425 [Alphaproteobacteria bacterium 33-17]
MLSQTPQAYIIKQHIDYDDAKKEIIANLQIDPDKVKGDFLKHLQNNEFELALVYAKNYKPNIHHFINYWDEKGVTPIQVILQKLSETHLDGMHETLAHILSIVIQHSSDTILSNNMIGDRVKPAVKALEVDKTDNLRRFRLFTSFDSMTRLYKYSEFYVNGGFKKIEEKSQAILKELFNNLIREDYPVPDSQIIIKSFKKESLGKLLGFLNLCNFSMKEVNEKGQAVFEDDAIINYSRLNKLYKDFFTFSKEVQMQILDIGLDVNMKFSFPDKPDQTTTLFRYALKQGKFDIAEIMLKKYHADPNPQNANLIQSTIVMDYNPGANKIGHLGSSVPINDEVNEYDIGTTPLKYILRTAQTQEHIRFLGTLLEHGASPNRQHVSFSGNFIAGSNRYTILSEIVNYEYNMFYEAFKILMPSQLEFFSKTSDPIHSRKKDFLRQLITANQTESLLHVLSPEVEERYKINFRTSFAELGNHDIAFLLLKKFTDQNQWNNAKILEALKFIDAHKLEKNASYEQKTILDLFCATKIKKNFQEAQEIFTKMRLSGYQNASKELSIITAAYTSDEKSLKYIFDNPPIVRKEIAYTISNMQRIPMYNDVPLEYSKQVLGKAFWISILLENESMATTLYKKMGGYRSLSNKLDVAQQGHDLAKLIKFGASINSCRMFINIVSYKLQNQENDVICDLLKNDKQKLEAILDGITIEKEPDTNDNNLDHPLQIVSNNNARNKLDEEVKDQTIVIPVSEIFGRDIKPADLPNNNEQSLTKAERRKKQKAESKRSAEEERKSPKPNEVGKK